jgi:hypothetical protein
MTTFRKQMKNLIQCKINGICARDQLVTEYIGNRVDWHKNFRNSGLQRIRQSWELDCPIECPPPVGE